MVPALISEIRKAIRQLNPGEVIELSERPVRVLLHAADEATYAFLERFLVPGGASEAAASMVFRQGHIADAEVVIVDAALPLPKGAFRFDRHRPEKLIESILDKRPELHLALARSFPAFRPAVSERVRHSVSKENALFALAAALPNIAPVLGWLPWAVPEAVSGTAVLTVNQIRMALLLAAANGRPIGFREQKAEVAAIVAGALGWRTLARELIGKIPFGAGLIPKAAVAYAATWIEGRSLEQLYAHGFRFTRKQRSDVRDEAMSRGKQAARAFLDAYRASHSEAKYPGAAAH